jgi:multidrug efflux pump subunit AcrA (membrane-fusion protein)
MKNRITPFLVLLLVAVFSLPSCSGEDKTENKDEVFLPLVKMQKAEKKTFEHKISVQGNVETDQDVLLNSEMGGMVTKIHVTDISALCVYA